MQDSTTPAGLRWFHRLDGILRNLARRESEGAERPSLKELFATAIGCAALYGVMMGLYAVSMRGTPGLLQCLASLMKVPLLFGLTVVVTFPSFYVLSVVRGVPLVGSELLRVQLVGIALTTTLLASFAPIAVFFTLSTDSHGFLLLMHVLFFLGAGLLGMRSTWSKGLRVLKPQVETGAAPIGPPPAESARVAKGSPAVRSSGQGLLRAWFVLAFIVAAQSAWILRPLIGQPDDGFVLFEPRESNALAGFLELLLRPGG